MRLQEGNLRCVLCVLSVTEHPECEEVQLAPVFLVPALEPRPDLVVALGLVRKRHGGHVRDIPAERISCTGG